MSGAAVAVRGAAGVASGHRLASEAGVEALRAGGSAVDAALAAAFTQWVVNAPQCGPGGEMVALVAPADGAAGDHASGRSVRRMVAGSADARRQRAAALYPASTAPADRATLSCPGRCGARRRCGGRTGASAGRSCLGPRLPQRQATPSPHAWPRSTRRFRARGHVEALRARPGAREQAPSRGDTIRMPQLALTLETVASGGADAFYTGDLAARLVAAAQAEGAPLSHDDLDAVAATVEPAIGASSWTTWSSGCRALRARPR